MSDDPDPLEIANDALTELQLVFLSGKARPKPEAHELHEGIWKHFAQVVATLAVLQDETPQSICEQGFTFVPTNEQWRDDLLPRLKEGRA